MTGKYSFLARNSHGFLNLFDLLTHFGLCSVLLLWSTWRILPASNRLTLKNNYYRFQMLRELIPHSDQKRDKASFLLEVCTYMFSILPSPNITNCWIIGFYMVSFFFPGYRIHSVFTGKSNQVWGSIPRMEPWSSKIDALGNPFSSLYILCYLQCGRIVSRGTLNLYLKVASLTFVAWFGTEK